MPGKLVEYDNSLKGELVAVQIIRGVAAASVVVSHAFAAAALPKYYGVELFSNWAAIGRSGVELFFILSGFLMYNIHQKDFSKPERVLRYCGRRAIRIYPIYWVYVSTAILALWLLSDLPKIDALDVLTIYSLVRASDVTLPLGVAWTLFHEVIFYGIFGIALWNGKIGKVILLLWFVSVLLLGIVPAPNFLSIVFSEINILFGFGIILAGIYKLRVIQHGSLLLFVGVIAYGATFDLLERHNSQPEFLLRTAGYGFSGCLIIYGLLCAEAEGRLKKSSILVLLGDASYSVYLLHFPLVSALFKLAAFCGLLSTQFAALVTIVVAIMAIALSVVMYLLFERRLQRWLNYQFNRLIKGRPSSLSRSSSE